MKKWPHADERYFPGCDKARRCIWGSDGGLHPRVALTIVSVATGGAGKLRHRRLVSDPPTVCVVAAAARRDR
jgi:hypothetical protein